MGAKNQLRARINRKQTAISQGTVSVLVLAEPPPPEAVALYSVCFSPPPTSLDF